MITETLRQIDVQELLEACKEAQAWLVQAHNEGVLYLNWKLDQRLSRAIDRMEEKWQTKN